jgi:hypothetical protein
LLAKANERFDVIRTTETTTKDKLIEDIAKLKKEIAVFINN